MKKLILVILLLSCCASALEVNPNRVSLTVKKDSIEFHELTIINDKNQTESITISSTDTSIVLPGMSSLSLAPNTETTFYLIIRGKEGLAYIKISDSDDINIPVEISIKEEQVGFLEPAFTLYKKTFEEGVTSKIRMSLRSHYPEKIEIRDILLEGDVIFTSDGVSKPIGYEGSFGFLNPEQDLSIDVTVNTVNLEPGTYSCKMVVVYYYKNVRYETPINFEISVIKSLEPKKEEEKLNEFDILISPNVPKVGEKLVINVVDKKTRDRIDVNIKVSEYDIKTNEKIISYPYAGSISVESVKYCVNVSKEGYNSQEKCFKPEPTESKIKIAPEPSVGHLSVITMVDLMGYPIQGATLTINGNSYPNQASITFEEGKYDIVGKAEGYKDAEYSFTLEKKFSYSIGKEPNNVGDELSIEFSKSVPWSIELDKDGKSTVVDYGTSDAISFTPSESGKYYVIANDDVIYSFELVEQSLIPNLGIPWWSGLIILFIVGVFVYRKKKKEPVRVGYGLGQERKKPSTIQEISE